MSTGADNFSLEINSWADLSSLVEHFSYFSAHGWLFRGITDAQHGLVPKIGRVTTRAKKRPPGSHSFQRVPYRLADEMAVFEMFRRQALSHIPRAPSTSLEWLAVAQHFGVPTRLLDWTESLLVAAWFAVEKAGAKDNGANAAICVTRADKAISAEDPRDPFKIKTPSVYRPAHVSPRILAQASVLMICPKPAQEVVLPFYRKIVIARKVEFTLKKRLNACGMNKRALFPDLQGLAEHLAWLHKNDYLASYAAAPKSKVRSTPDTEDQ